MYSLNLVKLDLDNIDSLIDFCKFYDLEIHSFDKNYNDFKYLIIDVTTPGSEEIIAFIKRGSTRVEFVSEFGDFIHNMEVSENFGEMDIDKILDKISKWGVDSLTEMELEFLKKME